MLFARIAPEVPRDSLRLVGEERLSAASSAPPPNQDKANRGLSRAQALAPYIKKHGALEL